MGPVNIFVLFCFLVLLGICNARKECTRVTLQSTQSEPDSTIIRDADGNPRNIVRVKVWDQISAIKCENLSTYQYSGAFLVARDGCKAQFRVCYNIPGDTTPAPLTTVSPGCQVVRLLSRQARPVSQTLDSDVLSITLLRDLNADRVPCVEGENFGFHDITVFASGGCRGAFEVCTSGVAALTTPAPPDNFRCEEITLRSTKLSPAQRTLRDANGNTVDIASVEVVEQISAVKCREWKTYFVSGSRLTAKRGCQARFKLCYKAPATTAAALTTEAPVQCKRYRVLEPTRLRVRNGNGNPVTISSVELRREISRGVCARNTNYFISDSLFIVNGGCKGIFRLCYGVSTTAAALTTAPPNDIRCKRVTVRSTSSQSGRERIRDENGDPVHIVRVKVWDQISAVKCVKRVNFFYGDSFIRVTNGCYATFKVCYEPKVATTPAALTTAITPEPGCELVELRSRKTKPDVEVYSDVTISSMKLVRQDSGVKCRFRKTYGYEGSRAYAKKGCRGLFQVCLEAAALTTESSVICKRVRVLKSGTQRIRDSNGQPVEITAVVLIREISRDTCVEGVNYRFRGSALRVNGGCKGVFQVCYGAVPTTAAALTTEAPVSCKKVTVKGRKTIRDASGNPVKITHVHVWDQISRTKCVEWDNYFVYDSYIRTQDGCHATFKVCYTTHVPTTAAALTTGSPVKCKTYAILKNTRRVVRNSNNVPATIVSLTLRREVSQGRCVEGISYFYRGSRVVIKNGCRGIFEVCYLDGVSTPAPLTTESSKPNCKKVTIRSTRNRSGRADITDENGNAVEIVRVRVQEQISSVQCQQWVNYFVFTSYIVVNSGCSATFKVCYRPGLVTTAAALTTASPIQCKIVKVKKPTRKIVRDSNGNPAEITRLALRQEFSSGVCERGTNFFFRDSLFVVRGACKGLFRICYRDGAATTAAALTTEALPTCEKIDVRSRGGNSDRVEVTDANGNPVNIVHVHVWDQISAIKCVAFHNYFYGSSYIVARDGCQATFKVCYVVESVAALTTAGPEVCTPKKITENTRRIVTDSSGQPTEVTRLELRREISDSVCVQGTNYFFNGPLLVVRGGCQGFFYICYRDSAAALTTAFPGVCTTVNVKSYGKYKARDANGDPVDIARVRVLEDLGQAECVEGTNFFVNGPLLRVTNGCRGEFEVCYLAVTTTPAALTTAATDICDRRTFVKKTHRVIRDSNGDTVEITSFVLLDEISDGVCEEGVNYSFEGSTVVVKGGCKGEFRICYSDTTAALTTAFPGECKEVEAGSTGNTVQKVKVKDENGNPVDIARVRVLDQISSVECEEDVNYFVSGNVLKIKGCKAKFEICYLPVTTTAAAALTTASAVSCRFITMKEDGQRNVNDKNGNPAVITSVTVEREFSADVCVLDDTFSFQGSVVEVNSGCQAVLDVCFEAQPPPSTPAALTTQDPTVKCRKYTFKQPVVREFTLDGAAAQVVSVDLVKNVDNGVCTEGTNYSFTETALTISGTCKGVFYICLKPADSASQ